MRSSSSPRAQAAALDQYYTKGQVAWSCWRKLQQITRRLGVSLEESRIIEPSAGGGAFLDTAPAGVVVHGFDVSPAPHREDIRFHDFLADSLPRLPGPRRDGAHIVVGNPPFGKKSSLVHAFIERAFTHAQADIVAFIVPLAMRKWAAQRCLDTSIRLIADVDLPEEAFEFRGKPYGLRCCFQIWVADGIASSLPDLRVRAAPPTLHPDFTAYQCNRMPGTDAHFRRAWDFAVPMSGFADYTVKAFRAKDCDLRKHWILFKAHSPRALRRLQRLDFVALSQERTVVPGFGKADVVKAYEEEVAAEKKCARRSVAERRGKFTRGRSLYPRMIRSEIRNASGYGSKTMSKNTAFRSARAASRHAGVCADRFLLAPASNARIGASNPPAGNVRRKPVAPVEPNAVAAKPTKKTVGYDKTVGEETWLTPVEIVRSLGPFDLDPATPQNGMPWRTATRMLKPSDDGLATFWPKSDFVWHNPPYGKGMGEWLKKAANHGNGLTLIFARTDTQAFHENVWRHPNATAVFFFEGRLQFCNPKGNKVGSAGAASVLIAYGKKARARLEAAVLSGALNGRVIVLDKAQARVWQAGLRKRAA